MDRLLALDQNLLLAINGFDSPFLDFLMIWASNRWIWIPLYLWMAFLLYRRIGWIQFAYALLILVLVIVLTDQTTSSILKPIVARPRPCHVPWLAPVLHLVNGKCGGPYGFASSHAANFFGLAVYLTLILRNKPYGLPFLLFGVAFLVAYSRVYLGVHYPLDVIGGMLIGLFWGGIGFWFFTILRTKRWHSGN